MYFLNPLRRLGYLIQPERTQQNSLSCRHLQDGKWAISSCSSELSENSYNVKVVLFGKMVTAQLQILIPDFLTAIKENENSLG